MMQGGLEGIPIPLERTMSELEMRIMADVVRLIRVNGFSTAKADWQIQRMIQLGESEENIKQWIRETLAVTDAELDHIFSDTVYEQYYGYQRWKEADPVRGESGASGSSGIGEGADEGGIQESHEFVRVRDTQSGYGEDLLSSVDAVLPGDAGWCGDGHRVWCGEL